MRQAHLVLDLRPFWIGGGNGHWASGFDVMHDELLIGNNDPRDGWQW